jgi:hypothetical protein
VLIFVLFFRAKRVRDVLGRTVRDGKAPADLGSLRAAAAMLPRIEKVTPASALSDVIMYVCVSLGWLHEVVSRLVASGFLAHQ